MPKTRASGGIGPGHLRCKMASEKIGIERQVIKSKAFREMSGIAILVYLDFLMKCRIKPVNSKPGRAKGFVITNNGEIEFTYAEALSKGITRPRFKRALRELVERGFIDIAHAGSGGFKGDKSKYSISDRWRAWDTDGFERATMPKDRRKGRGFDVVWAKRKSNIGNAGVT